MVLELSDLYALVTDGPGFGTLFADGPINFIIQFLLNQLRTFIDAITWFDYWSDFTEDISVAPLFILAMAAFWLGNRAAKAWPL